MVERGASLVAQKPPFFIAVLVRPVSAPSESHAPHLTISPKLSGSVRRSPCARLASYNSMNGFSNAMIVLSFPVHYILGTTSSGDGHWM